MASQWIKYGAVFAAGALAVGGGVTLGMFLDRPAVVAQDGATAPAPVPNGATPEATVHSDEKGLTAIGSLQRNTMVSVQGVVQRITDEDEFQLADDTGSIQVSTGNQFFTVEQGETVTVSGFVDDDLILEIYAQEITRQDGSVVTIGRPGSE